MSVIIPYNEKLESSRGAFIKPNGEILFIPNDHDEFADDYCYYLFHNQLQNGVFSDNELKLYKEWCKSGLSFSDFMLFILSFDKVEIGWRKVITTPDRNPHIRFFNYYLMDYNIYQSSKMQYNDVSKNFEFIKSDSYLESFADSEAESQISEIKAKVLKKDRYLFFKK